MRKLLGKEDMKYTPKPKSKTVQVTLLSAIRDKAAHHVESSNEFRKCNRMIVEAQKKEEETEDLLEEEDSSDFITVEV